MFDHRGKTLTAFDQKIANVVAAASLAAIADQDDTFAKFKVVSAPTGSGKSSFAVCFGAALYETNPDSSIAYVVETMTQAEAVYRDLKAILPAGASLAVYTSAHNIKRNSEAILRDEGWLPEDRFDRDTLASFRVVVVTHKLWLNEMSGDAQRVRFYNPGTALRHRDLMFVDEQPSLVNIFDVTPGQVLSLRDHLNATHAGHALVETVEGVHARMEAIYQATASGKGAPQYSSVEVVTPFDAMLIETTVDPEFESSLACNGWSRDDVRNVFGFMLAAARGYCFVARYTITKGGNFMAYGMTVKPGPGCVVLDATADLSGMVSLCPGMELVEAPKVDFSALEVVHLTAPREVVPARTRIANLITTRDGAEPYARWIEQSVIEQSQPGDRVLVVVHKKLLDHGYLESTHDPENPLDWEGRKVCVIHWGYGIGSNRWKDHQVVCLFGEFYRPRRATVACTLGMKQQEPTQENLKGAAGSRFTGDYLTADEGHLLRWTKQLAARGNVRNIDSDGRCGAMKLVTSMEFHRLTRLRHLLFPGCKSIRFAGAERLPRDTSRGKVGLINLLRFSDAGELTSKTIVEQTGVDMSKVAARYFRDPGVTGAMEAHGWSWATSRGRGNVARFVRSSAAPMQAA
jgi:hypothetical protein